MVNGKDFSPPTISSRPSHSGHTKSFLEATKSRPSLYSYPQKSAESQPSCGKETWSTSGRKDGSSILALLASSMSGSVTTCSLDSEHANCKTNHNNVQRPWSKSPP